MADVRMSPTDSAQVDERPYCVEDVDSYGGGADWHVGWGVWSGHSGPVGRIPWTARRIFERYAVSS